MLDSRDQAAIAFEGLLQFIVKSEFNPDSHNRILELLAEAREEEKFKEDSRLFLLIESATQYVLFLGTD